MKYKIFFLFAALITFSNSILQAQYFQNLKIGKDFNPYLNEFILQGISTKDDTHLYITKNAPPEILYERKVDQIIVGTINNLIVKKMCLLIPNSNDTGIPESLVKLIEKKLGILFAQKESYYGAILDGVRITISRKNGDVITGYKDRIVIYYGRV